MIPALRSLRLRHMPALLALAITLISGICQALPSDTTRAVPPTAKLGILLIIDQMRPDYLTRFRDQFTGGLARLEHQGLLFTNAFHDHAATETAVGHATVATGRFPSHHGIVGNEWYDRELNRTIYACEDSSSHILGEPKMVGRSPKLLLGQALGDWLKRIRPEAKVYSISLKDRSAIEMGGKKPNGVFWYNRSTGNFITSEYYASAMPAWLDSFNTAREVILPCHTGWRTLMPDSAYRLSHRDDFPSENDGKNITFPHLFDTTSAAPDKKYFDAFYGTPFADGLLLSLARSTIRAADLGRDSIPDLLCISCSAADAIGHAYGPNSWEIQDYYLRLDRYLDTFLIFLDSAVGKDNYCIAVSADHAVLPLPEDLVDQGIAARRLSIDTVIWDTRQIGAQIETDLKLGANPIADCGYDVLLDYSGSRQRGLSDPDFQQIVANRLRKLPYIADIFTRDELQSGSGEGRPYFEQFRNSFHPLRGPDLYVRFQEYVLPGKSNFGTSHGTPYPYDTDIPILFLSRITPAGQNAERVPSVALAPTLARLLGVQVGARNMDGQVLLPVLGEK
jgi:predicted AlkP superfamily pyrophosphatase or phosphodiesterase